MSDPSLSDIPAGVGGAGAVGVLWGLKSLYDSWRGRQRDKSEDKARDASTDLSVAAGGLFRAGPGDRTDELPRLRQ